MPHPAGLICEGCAQRLASFERGSLDVAPTVRVVVRPAASGQDTTIILICRCGSDRLWHPGGYEVKAGGAAAGR